MPFGWQPDLMTAEPAEAAAVADACRVLQAGGTVSGVAREWDRRGLRPRRAPFGPLPERAWTRVSVRDVLSNPRIAGILVSRGIEVGRGEWAHW